MLVPIEIEESAFRTPKTPEEVAEDLRQAVVAFWIARGDIAPEAAREITVRVQRVPATAGGLVGKDRLSSMAEVGEDADFERPLCRERAVVELD